LLIVAAGLFVVGVTSENDNDAHNDEPAADTAAADGHDEATESAEAIEAEAEERSTSEAEEDEADEVKERVLGIDVESPVLVATAVISLPLAGLVWRGPDRRLLIIIAVFGASFAVLDAAEVAHQLDEDSTGLSLVAGAIAALHAAAAALALHQATTRVAREPVTS
jgi:hypothetical protein